MNNFNLTSVKMQFSTRKATYLILSLACIALFLGSCKKDGDDDDDDGRDDSGSYMISFKANGVFQEFTSEDFTKGAFSDNGTQYSSIVTGTRSSGQIAIGVEVFDNKAISETTYTGYVVTEATSQTPAYVVGASINYRDQQMIYLTGAQSPNVTIKITAITATSVQGTFSGTLKSGGGPDIVITEGKFYVPIGSISS